MSDEQWQRPDRRDRFANGDELPGVYPDWSTAVRKLGPAFGLILLVIGVVVWLILTW